MLTTTLKGHLALLEVERAATAKEFITSRPSIEARYDLVVDDGKKLHRVQVKYSSQDSGGECIIVELRKFGGNKQVGVRLSDVKVYTKDEIDAVAVFSPATGKVYWVPVSVMGGMSNFRLRIKPSKNGQKQGVRMASEFEW